MPREHTSSNPKIRKQHVCKFVGKMSAQVVGASWFKSFYFPQEPILIRKIPEKYRNMVHVHRYYLQTFRHSQMSDVCGDQENRTTFISFE